MTKEMKEIKIEYAKKLNDYEVKKVKEYKIILLQIYDSYSFMLEK
jgi:hypothetical protein